MQRNPNPDHVVVAPPTPVDDGTGTTGADAAAAVVGTTGADAAAAVVSFVTSTTMTWFIPTLLQYGCNKSVHGRLRVHHITRV